MGNTYMHTYIRTYTYKHKYKGKYEATGVREAAKVGFCSLVVAVSVPTHSFVSSNQYV
jgi:hypothetical protein